MIAALKIISRVHSTMDGPGIGGGGGGGGVTVHARTTVQCMPIAVACACMDTYKRACVRIFMCM